MVRLLVLMAPHEIRLKLPLPTKEHDMIRKFILIASAAGIALTATACNTVKGLGRDVQSVGQAGSDAIN